MNGKRIAFFVFFFFLVSLCFGEMTIYFKDGREKRVQKIVFHGSKADLYTTDGSVITVPVSELDLETSGIGEPVGTYGETRVTRPGRQQVGAGRMPGPGTAARQAELAAEWDKAPITAKAKKNVGSIRAGDSVRAYTVGSQAEREVTRYIYFWYDDDTDTLWYDEDLKTTLAPDSAYIIIYKNTNGTFGKKILDAVTFDSSFDVPKAKPEPRPESNPPASSEPIPAPPPQLPLENKPAEQPPTLENQQPQEEPAGEESADEQTSAQSETPEESESGTGSGFVVLVIVGVLGAGILVLLYVLFQKRSKPFVDEARFHQYEQDLRDFELDIWLRHGKTLDQLIEICVKKFYQDNPAALSIVTRMLKGGQKNMFVSMIVKQAGVQAAAAETIYSGFAERIEIVRGLIDEVSAKKGIAPVRPAPQPPPKADVTAKPLLQSAAGATQKVIPPVAPKPAPTPPTRPAGPAKPVQLASAPKPWPLPSLPAEISIPIPDAPQKRSSKKKTGPAADLPAYAAGVFNQIGFLTSDEK